MEEELAAGPEPVATGTGAGEGYGAEPTDVEEAAAAARRVVAALLHAGDRPGAELRDVAATLHGLADRLDAHAPATEARLAEMWADDGAVRHDPVAARRNPLAPPLTLTRRDDGSVTAVTTLGLPYQGPPGCVHGGISALLLDHTLGAASRRAGEPAVTGQLTLRYRRPTPLFAPLTLEARRLSVAGRRIQAEGTLSADGRVCVSATGLFVAHRLPRPR
ncbi:PaaI family thioesterase [Streptomyces sp. AJS327]|uniref:PaaI family thioesterase n=1 Tax=Streptomyces sp. AJS327 TaxID=2545265 RepID=UPI0015DF191F|nr:PaaI family thioesterase [Streptomyces sp. AJS327]MBA0051188.1 PaaI family thioesterase [Streptomyces sp. AJS327]